LVEAGLIHARGGKVRLLKRDELPASWDPVTDSKVRHWEITQHLIRALETGGETAAADLLRRVGGMGEAARDLAYRLYNLCERKKWASEALAYNGLVIAWPEISKLAQGQPTVAKGIQQQMF
jgi:putative DNA methylase